MHLHKRITGFITMMSLSVITAISVTTALACPVNARYDEVKAEPVIGDDYVFTSGDWQYYIMGENPVVCGYTGADEKITIPTEIDGKKVTKVSGRKTSDKILSFTEEKFSFFSGKAANVKEVIIPEGVLAIGIYTFQSSGIEKITLPKSLISIGCSAFWSCKSLESVTIPENVKVIGENAFGESGLKEVYLPEGLQSIGRFAFGSAYDLKRIYIPDTVTEIGESAFSETALEEVTLPKGIVKAESNIFYGCKELKKACISEGTVIVEEGLFHNCTALEEIYLPSTLNSLQGIVTYSQSLKTVNFAGSREECENLYGENIIFDLLIQWDYIFDDNNDMQAFLTTEQIDKIKINYGVPVPIAQPIPVPVPDPEEKFTLDAEVIFLAVITALGIILTVGFAAAFIKRTRGIQKKRAEEKIKEEKEGFHPEILGVWQCERCKTLNGPIAAYCYKCGRKKGENQ